MTVEVSNSYCSIMSGIIIRLLGAFVDQHKLGWVTTPDGGYMVGGERYIPDAAFISIAKYPKAPRETYIAQPPDLAVEIISPTDNEADLRAKLVNYVRAGTTVWVVNPDQQFVQVFPPDQAPKVVDINGTIDGGNVLPGFTLAVKDIFPE
jgi:Uma2 family endonuclease